MQLTSEQAYLAMFAFLEAQFERGGMEELGVLLGALSLLPDGRPADAALREDWAQAVEAAIAGAVQTQLVFKR